MSNLKEICYNYFNLFSNKNIDNLVELFSDDIELMDWNINVHGKYAVRQEYKNIYNDVVTIVATPINLYEENNTVCCEIIININNDTEIQVMDVITFNDNLKINKIKAYKI